LSASIIWRVLFCTSLRYNGGIHTTIVVVGYPPEYTAIKEPVHFICEMMELSKPINPPSQAKAVDSLKKALYLMDEAASHANLLNNEWCEKINFKPCSPSSCNEEKKKSILHLLEEAADLSTKWNKAVSYATMMLWQAESIVDVLLTNIGKKTKGYEALIAIKTGMAWFNPKWQQTSSDVGMVHHNNIAAAEQWRKAITSGIFRELLNSGQAYEYVEKVCRAAGWKRFESEDLNEETIYYWMFELKGFNLEIFFPEEEIRNGLLDLESSLCPSLDTETPSLHGMSKQTVIKSLERRILRVDETIDEIICFLDTKPVEQMIQWIDVQNLVEKSLIELEKPASTWNQKMSAAGNALREMMETLHLLSSILDQGNERQKWLTIRAEAEKMLPSWASYIYGINQLFHRTEEARVIWQTLSQTNSSTKKRLPDLWYACVSSIPEEEREAVEATLRILYHIDWMFRNDKSNEGYHQNRFAQMIYDWMRWKAQLLESETSPSSLLATSESDVYHQSLGLDSITPPAFIIKREAIRWLKMKQLPAIDQKVVQALTFPEKWPDEEVSLLEKGKSPETLSHVKKLVSAWFQDMSIAKEAIREILTPIAILSALAASPSEVGMKANADKIYLSWCNYTQRIEKLANKIVDVEDRWQSLVDTQTVSTTTLSLNEDSVQETKTHTEPPAKIHVNVRISLHPMHLFSRAFSNRLTNNEEYQTILATDSFIQDAREILYSFFTGQCRDLIYTLDSAGQRNETLRIRRRIPWLGYDWFQLKHQLQRLDASLA
jgi:hypothetical protein